MTPGDPTVEVALDAHAALGEGPVWDDASGALIWVDILGQAVHRFDQASGRDRVVVVGQSSPFETVTPLSMRAFRRTPSSRPRTARADRTCHRSCGWSAHQPRWVPPAQLDRRPRRGGRNRRAVQARSQTPRRGGPAVTQSSNTVSLKVRIQSIQGAHAASPSARQRCEMTAEDSCLVMVTAKNQIARVSPAGPLMRPSAAGQRGLESVASRYPRRR
jgi:hypothetical protein